MVKLQNSAMKIFVQLDGFCFLDSIGSKISDTSIATVPARIPSGNYSRKNSGAFDGAYLRSGNRKISTGNRKISLSRKVSATQKAEIERKQSQASQNIQILANMYDELERLDDLCSSGSSSSESEDEEDTKNKGKHVKKGKNKHKRKGSITSTDDDNEDEGFCTSKSDQATTPVEENDISKIHSLDISARKKSSTSNLRSISTNLRLSDANLKSSSSSLSKKAEPPPPPKVTIPALTLQSSSKYPARNLLQKKMGSHKDINSNRLSMLFFEEPESAPQTRETAGNFDSLPRKRKPSRHKSLPPVLRRSLRRKNEEQEKSTLAIPRSKESYSPTKSMYPLHLFDHGGSTSSCNTLDSTRGSIPSVATSVSMNSMHGGDRLTMPRNSVPMNFIPGRTPSTKGVRPVFIQQRATFCFKGITCQILGTMPKTYKALAHAGCVGLIIPGPSQHTCDS